MKENTLSRIKEYLDYKGISNRAFELQFGFSNGSFASQLKNGKTIGVDRLENILKVYVDINVEWLLTGRGSMLHDELATATAEPTIIYKSDPKDAEIIAAKQLIIQRDAELIDSLRSKIKELEAQLHDHTLGLRSAPAVDTPSVGGCQTSVK